MRMEVLIVFATAFLCQLFDLTNGQQPTIDCVTAKQQRPNLDCAPDGSFMPRQCVAAENKCFCVDKLGTEIKGTRHSPWNNQGVDCNNYHGKLSQRSAFSTGINALSQFQCPPIVNEDCNRLSLQSCSPFQLNRCPQGQLCCQTTCNRYSCVSVGITNTLARASCTSVGCPVGQSCAAVRKPCGSGTLGECLVHECRFQSSTNNFRTSFSGHDCPSPFTLQPTIGTVNCVSDSDCAGVATSQPIKCCSAQNGRGICLTSNRNTGLLTNSLSELQCQQHKNQEWSPDKGNCVVTCGQAILGYTVARCETPEAGCICKAGTYVADDGRCLTVAKCRALLGKHDKTNANRGNFQATLPEDFSNHLQPRTFPQGPPNTNSGRFGGSITGGSGNSLNKCDSRNEEWSEFHGNCQITCEHIRTGIEPECPDNIFGSGCVCVANHARASNGVCIPIEACGAVGGPFFPGFLNQKANKASSQKECLGSNEIWSAIYGNCNLFCAQVRSGKQVPCHGEVPPKCVCKPGYARHDSKGQCIPEHECQKGSLAEHLQKYAADKPEKKHEVTPDGEGTKTAITSSKHKKLTQPNLISSATKYRTLGKPSLRCTGPNEVLTLTNGSSCHRTCDHVRKGYKLECYDIPKQTCTCRPGFARQTVADGECVLEKDCFPQSDIPEKAALIDKEVVSGSNFCPRPNEIRSTGCGDTCEPTCNPRGRTQQCQITCNPRCICRVGYIREFQGGGCIPSSSCTTFGGGIGPTPNQVVPSSQKCAANEVFYSCKHCDLTCAQLNTGVTTCSSNTNCRSGCFCKPGYFRQNPSGIGFCVARNQCNIPTTRTHTCTALNTEYSSCSASPDCQPNCFQQHPKQCGNCLSGCVCRTGFVRRNASSFECIHKAQCHSVIGSGNIGTQTFGGSQVVRKAIAVFSENGATGSVFLTQGIPNGPVSLSGTISGLPANAQMGLHVHERGDLSGGCSQIGGHLKTSATQVHADRTSPFRHVGDLGNIQSDNVGRAVVNFQDTRLSLNGQNSVIGRSLAVSSQRDDLGVTGIGSSARDGNSGNARACAVIGIQEVN